MTITEMARELNLPLETIRKRLLRTGCKPITKEAIYTRADFEKIKVAPMGRPPKKDKAPKKPVPEPTKPPAPKAKGKK